VSNLALRFLTAGVLIPVLVLAIRWENPIGWWAVVSTATLLGLLEFYGMTLAAARRSERVVGALLGLCVGQALYWFEGAAGERFAAALAGATLAAFLYYLFRYGNVETAAVRMSAMLAGFLYVGVLLTFATLLKKRPSGGAWVFILLTCTWFSDTGAYFAGRFLGKLWGTKLYESVSPKKTVVGALGGLCGSFGALALAKLWYLPGLSWVDCALIAVPANLLGQTGDLCESLLKRSVGVKDSGNLLPGHGGMLDRIDAVLFAAPWVYFYARFLYGNVRW
jgi:phosphatidate cytidylyltransferase